MHFTVSHSTNTATYPYKEVNGEENIEDEIDLLCGTFCPFITRLHRFSVHYTRHSFTKRYSSPEQVISELLGVTSATCHAIGLLTLIAPYIGSRLLALKYSSVVVNE